MRPKSAFSLVLLLMVLFAGFQVDAHAQPAALELTGPSQLRPYQEETLRIILPHPGTLRLYARDHDRLIPLLTLPNQQAGEHFLPFWGLDLCGEPLYKSVTGLLATLQSEGEELSAELALTVQAPIAALQYAVLSRDRLHQEGGEDLFVDHQTTRAARIDIALLKSDDLETPLRTWTIQRSDALPHRFRFDRRLRGKPLEPGDYALRLLVPDSAQEPLLRPFTLLPGREEPLPIAPMLAKDYLPQNLDDHSVWQAMQAPAAVLTIGARQHQYVYQEPSTKSAQLGMVHGQTAGLMVLETGVSGFVRVRVARHGDGEIIEGFVPENRLVMVQPSERYGLLLDKQRQTLTLYERGQKKGSLAISTGVYVPPGTDSFETLPGAFLTQDRMAQFDSFGFRYLYALRLDGGNLLHEAGFKLQSGLRDYSEQTATLGQKASHGCVRIDQRLGWEGLSPYWLYANLPRNTKVLVIPGEGQAFLPPQEHKAEPVPQADSPLEEAGFQNIDDQPLENEGQGDDAKTSPLPTSPRLPEATPEPMEQSTQPEPTGASLVPATTQTPAEAPPSVSPFTVTEEGHEDPPTKTAQPRGKTSITLTFGGDCVLGSEEHARSHPDSFDQTIERQGYSWPFSGLQEVFLKDDLTLINLENVLKDGKADRQDRLHNFRGHTDFARMLPMGGIDLVNLANNHFVDYGQAGRNSTRKALKDAGVPYAGYGSLYVYEKDGYLIGFAGIRETIYHQGRDRIKQEIQELKNRGCDYIVYTCHFGQEYEAQHNALQTQMAHAAIDAGANLVIGHHPHVVQGVEEYKGGLIFYSLGNLVFGGNLELSTFDGLLAQVRLEFDQDRLVQSTARLLPVLTSGTAPENDFRPLLASGPDKERILTTIWEDSQIAYPEEFDF